MFSDFNRLPPSYDDVIAAGSSRLVKGGGGSRTVLPFTPQPLSGVPETTSVIQEEQEHWPDIHHVSPPTNVSTTHQANTRTTPRVSTTSLDGAPRRQSNTRQVPRPSIQHPQQHLPSIPEEQPKSLVDQLALFSMPNIMLIGLMLPRVNVELDTEAHLPNRREAVRKARIINRIKTACGCFWLLGFISLFILIAVPVAMILTAVIGANDCPYSDNIFSKILSVLGCFLAIAVALRLIASAFSCCKIANLYGTKKSKGCSWFLLLMEILFLVIFVVFLIMVFLATWYVFAVSPNDSPASATDTDYCLKGFSTAATALISTDLSLAILLVLYLSTLAVFYTYYREYLTVQRHHRTKNTAARPPIVNDRPF